MHIEIDIEMIEVEIYKDRDVGFSGGSVVKNLPAKAEDMGSIPEFFQRRILLSRK